MLASVERHRLGRQKIKQRTDGDSISHALIPADQPFKIDRLRSEGRDVRPVGDGPSRP